MCLAPQERDAAGSKTNDDRRSADSQVQELRIDYTNCAQDAPTASLQEMDPDRVTTAFKGSNKNIQAKWRRFDNITVTPERGNEYETTICQLEFVVPENMGPPVLFYYHLTNFYQNHRRYVESFFDRQLLGDDVSVGAVKGSKCDPLAFDEEANKQIYPCGLIANSMFNDTFTSPWRVNEGNSPTVYQMENNTNIAWDSDSDLYGMTNLDPSQIVPPPNWRTQFPNYTAENLPDLKTWQGFQVWMRTAGLPEFSKLYQRNDEEPLVADGTYQVNITSSQFPSFAFCTKPTLTPSASRLPHSQVQGHQVHGHLHAHRHGRSQQLPRHRLRRCRRRLHPAGRPLHSDPPVEAEVSVPWSPWCRPYADLLSSRKLGDHTYLSWNNTPGGKGGQAAGSGGVMASGRELRPGEA